MLTPRQVLFVAEYLKDSNATRAYLAAGYGKRGAEQCASRLLRNVKVQQEIELRRQQIRDESRVTIFSLMSDLEEVKKRCMQREAVLDINGNPTGEWKFDSRGALRAIELQGKHLGMFLEERDRNPAEDDNLGRQPIDLTAASTFELVEALLQKENPNGLQLRSREVIPLTAQSDAEGEESTACGTQNPAAEPSRATHDGGA